MIQFYYDSLYFIENIGFGSIACTEVSKINPMQLELAQQLSNRFKDLISSPVEFRGEATISLNNASAIAEVMQFAKSNLGFDMLLDICSVDHLGSDPRFEVVYHLYSFASHQYLRIKTFVSEENLELPTLSHLWKAADWHEREVFDMMGIRFRGHPDLRRILMWDSYPYHPLRKDFPLAGIPSPDGHANAVPMAGGPFVTSPGEMTTVDREPRGKGETNSVV